jgi:hypothetical protein
MMLNRAVKAGTIDDTARLIFVATISGAFMEMAKDGEKMTTDQWRVLAEEVSASSVGLASVFHKALGK